MNKKTPKEYLVDLDKLNIENIEFCKGNIKKALSTGWASLDNHIRIEKGRLAIISGFAGRGKSLFTDNLLFNLTKLYGWKHLICSFEEDANCYLKKYKQFYTQATDEEMTRLKMEGHLTIFQEFKSHYNLITIEEMYKVDTIIEIAKYLVETQGLDTLLVDPYNRVDNMSSKDLNETLRINELLTKLQFFAKKYNVFVIVIAHQANNREERPSIYNISGSAHWANQADYCLCIHRKRDLETNKLSENTSIFIEKIKNTTLGNPSGGMVLLRYDINGNMLKDMYENN